MTIEGHETPTISAVKCKCDLSGPLFAFSPTGGVGDELLVGAHGNGDVFTGIVADRRLQGLVAENAGDHRVAPETD